MNSWWQKALFVLLLILVIMRYGPAVAVQSTVTNKQDSFSVTGQGKVTVVPDTGIVEMGITSNKPTVKAAQTEANTVISSITKALKGLKVDEKDIKTSNYSVYPQYDYQPNGVNRITGYSVTASLTVTVREIDKINEVVDAATNNGANTIGGIQLTIDETQQKKLMQQARVEAINEAKEKAESLAKASGISLGKIINVIESPNDTYPRPLMYATKEVGQGGAMDLANTNIQPGSTDISTSVTLFYETR
ncbi:MAG: SIMPL domain-containing protein [Candidatus Magasanikbacteria bacterium]|nr:SIMPL domain-containing protein [Candidatus Magasanikbacteria bacterium]